MQILLIVFFIGMISLTATLMALIVVTDKKNSTKSDDKTGQLNVSKTVSGPLDSVEKEVAADKKPVAVPGRQDSESAESKEKGLYENIKFYTENADSDKRFEIRAERASSDNSIVLPDGGSPPSQPDPAAVRTGEIKAGSPANVSDVKLLEVIKPVSAFETKGKEIEPVMDIKPVNETVKSGSEPAQVKKEAVQSVSPEPGKMDGQKPAEPKKAASDFADLFAKNTVEENEASQLAVGMNDVDVNDLLKEGRELVSKLRKRTS